MMYENFIIDEVMTTKFFDGKSLEGILDDITDLEY